MPNEVTNQGRVEGVTGLTMEGVWYPYASGAYVDNGISRQIPAQPAVEPASASPAIPAQSQAPQNPYAVTRRAGGMERFRETRSQSPSSIRSRPSAFGLGGYGSGGIPDIGQQAGMVERNVEYGRTLGLSPQDYVAKAKNWKALKPGTLPTAEVWRMGGKTHVETLLPPDAGPIKPIKVDGKWTVALPDGTVWRGDRRPVQAKWVGPQSSREPMAESGQMIEIPGRYELDQGRAMMDDPGLRVAMDAANNLGWEGEPRSVAARAQYANPLSSLDQSTREQIAANRVTRWLKSFGLTSARTEQQPRLGETGLGAY